MLSVKTDHLIRILIGFLLAAFVFVIYDGIHERIIGVGDTAPEFSITTDNGRIITNTNFGGKILVLNFWATWCPPCVEEMPSLEKFHQTLGPAGVVVLGISVDKDQQAYRNFVERSKISFLTGRDPENNINAEFGTFKYPETYIINSQGQVVQKIIGKADWMDPDMISYIKSLL